METEITPQETEVKEYALAYGFRRLSACKKLGWETIPAFIQDTGKIIDLPIKQIQVIDNTRLNEADDEFISLMNSIKQHGLLEPVGVWRNKDLDEERFLILNLTENMLRKDVSPVELSKGIHRLKKLGLNDGEISARLSIPKSRIHTLIRLSQKLPKKVLEELSFIENTHDKKGRLPVSVVNVISLSRFKDEKESVKFLIEQAKKNEWTVREISIIIDFTKQGMSLKEAIDNLDKYMAKDFKVIINKAEYEKLPGDLKNIPFRELVLKALYGEFKPDKKLFYRN